MKIKEMKQLGLYCPRCEKRLIKMKDPITNKISKYDYHCPCNKKLAVSVG